MPINPLYPTQDFSGFNVIGLEGLQFDGNASLGNLNVDNLLVDDDFISLNNIIILADTSNISVIDNNTLLGMGLKNNSLGVETIFTSQTNKGVSGTTTNNDFSLISNDIERILVKADGNIGIGNSNPMNPLSVEGNIYSNNIASLTSSVNNLTGNVSNLQQRMNVVEGNISILNGNVSSLTTRVADTEANIALLFTLSGNLDANINLITTRLANIENEINTGNLSTLEVLNGNTFINSGNFGLGTPTPTSKLQILGNADISGSITSNSLNTSGITLTPTTTNLNLGSSTTLQNKLNVNATTSQDKFIRFRRGGGAPVGYSGLQFSDFDTHSFYQGAFNDTLEFTYAAGNPTDRGNVGTPILSLNSFGNVGIGTTTPSGRFQVRTDAGNVSTIENSCDGSPGFQGISNTQASVKSFYGSSNFIPGGSACLGSVSNHPTLIGTNNTERMRILTDGNVGIGTSTPNQKLEVNGNINISGDYLINGSPIAASKWVQAANDIYNTNSGNVGIGTTSPSAKLDVVDQFGFIQVRNSANTQHSQINSGFIELKNPNNRFIDFGNTTGTDYLARIINSGDSQDLRFENLGGERMRITGDGNVGIGTSTPSFKLDVNGTARTTGQTLLATSSGDVGIGTTSPSEKLDVSGNISLSGGGSQFIKSTANNMRLQPDKNNSTGFLVIGNFTNSNKVYDLNVENTEFQIRARGQRMLLGANNYSFNTGGSFGTDNQRMVLLNDGNVGIGTTTPANKLDVRTADISYGIEHSSPTVRAATYVDGAATNRGFELGTITNHGMGFYTNNNTKMVITNTGNVGIGTTTPDNKLVIHGGTGGNDDLKLVLNHLGSSVNDRTSILFRDAGSNRFELITNIVPGGAPTFNMFSNWSNASRLFINENGSVGIGTTSPANKLDVRTADISYGIEHSSPTVRAATYIDGASLNRGFELGTITNHGMGFYTNNTTKMLITNTGNVGIGTTSPTQRLEVAGQVICDRLLIGDTGLNVKIGANTGLTNQGISAIAIGSSTATTNQGLASVAIGVNAGEINQGEFSVAIGPSTATTNQGNNCVSIGRAAGSSNQADNSMILNATGATLNNTTQNSFVVKPIRNPTDNNYELMGYNNTSGEIIRTGSLTTGNVGIGITSPASKLDVRTGNATYGIEHSTSSVRAATFINSSSTNREFQLGTITNHGIGFYTNNSQPHMVITNTGNVGIGTTTPSFELDVSGTARITGQTLLASVATGNVGIGTSSPSLKLEVVGPFGSNISGQSVSINFGALVQGSSGTGGFLILFNGDMQNTNNSYSGFSDKRKKENIIPCNSQIEDFKKYNFVNYNFIGKDEKHLGLIAQELLDISPGLVSYDENRDEYSVKYSILYLKACKCIQELIEKVENLENKINLLINEKT